ncbi:hypothetical protein HO173_011096 [Letharia columbiana]|uniref:Uncharacterized protein n=1 Tax=Letharia columbiana TaxID=112416 RepID=A0A8H6FL54_9LECA|nr:uncharacterized protein HO173_011096 [Letharia columbiana]KAF6230559.1 hypothetical protein HO173_011096 [Letharia columbiana]
MPFFPPRFKPATSVLFIYSSIHCLRNAMADAQTCFYPDGSVSTHDTPCHSPSIGDGASACCGSTDICLNNSLCLAQSGAELVTRGSCTDQTWQSPECPQYCSDENPSGGALIFLAGYLQDKFKFCCSQVILSNNTCNTTTKGSTAPFEIEAGLVILNRTSGSTSLNTTDAATVTVTATATATATPMATVTALTLPPNSSSFHNTSSTSPSSSSSSREAAIGAGMGVTLGLGLLVTLGLLWRLRKHKQILSKDIQTWEWKYSELMKAKTAIFAGAEHQPPHPLDCWNQDGLDGQPHLVPQLEGWKPDEIDGTEVYGLGNRTE